MGAGLLDTMQGQLLTGTQEAVVDHWCPWPLPRSDRAVLLTPIESDGTVCTPRSCDCEQKCIVSKRAFICPGSSLSSV